MALGGWRGAVYFFVGYSAVVESVRDVDMGKEYRNHTRDAWWKAVFVKSQFRLLLIAVADDQGL